MKKFLSLILALLMTVSCASFAFANEDAALDGADTAEEATPFDDAIQYLEAVGIFKGKEDGLLHAADLVKRYEMALLAARIATGWIDDDTWLNGNANDTEFTDLEGDVQEKYLGALSYAAQMGLIEGYGDGTFKPYDGITYRDVLTIACRLIGYKNLKYPWGFIEKAVNLGLTEGIEDVAYTEPLTRGGVAQVLYNALFTEVNNTTLAAELFGIELAWADIMVVANDRYVLAGKDASVCGAGEVAYQIISGNGLLPTVKKVDAAQFGLEIGQFYRALFSQKIGGGDYTLVKAEPYGVVGSADNNGRNDMDNVKSFIGGAVVLGFDKTGSFTVPGIDGYKYAYDVVTGHIWQLKPGTEGSQTLDKIKYYYSKDLDLYFEYDVEENGNVIYKPVDEVDLIDYLKDQFYDGTVKGGIGTMDKPNDVPYSHVDVVNAPNGKTVAYYESYQLGVYYDTTGKCKDFCSCGKDNSTTAYYFKALGLGSEGESTSKYCAGCGDCIGYELVGEAEDGDYVIYGVNTLTKEIKIVKVIGTDTTSDSYVAKGIVRGFRISQNYVTIGDQKLTYNYDGVGAPINFDYADYTKNDKDKTAADYSEKLEDMSNYFKGLVNQYVEYVVLDGRLVYVEVLNNGDAEYIIVENYVGFSSEGYITVGGYSTDNLCYELFQIAAYDQWKSGDKFWYPQNTMFEGDFARGSVYEVTSYDEEEDAYFVKTIYNAGDEIVLADTEELTFDGGHNWAKYEDGYIWDGSKYVENKAKKFVLIDIADNRGEFDKPIHVYEGKLPEDWYVSGDAIVDGNTVIFVETDDVAGFDRNAYDFSMAIVLDKNIVDMGYEGAIDDWYVMGAMHYEVEVFDLYEGTYRNVTGVINNELVEGAIYPVIDGMIIDAEPQYWYDFAGYYTDWSAKTAEYIISGWRYSYITGFTPGDLDDEGATWYDNFVSRNVNGKYYAYANAIDEAKVAKYYVTLNHTQYGATLKSIKSFADSDIAGFDPATVYCTTIYDVDNNEFVVYVYEGQAPHVHNYKTEGQTTIASTTTVTEDDKTTTIDVKTGLNVGTIEGKIVAEIAWSGTHTVTTTKTEWFCDCGDSTVVTNEPVTAAAWDDVTVESVTFKFVGLDEVEHAIVADKGYYFAIDKHADNNYDASVAYEYATKLNATIASGIYAAEYACEDGCHEACHVPGCDLVKALKYNVGLKLDGDATDATNTRYDFITFKFDQTNAADAYDLLGKIKVAFDEDDGLVAKNSLLTAASAADLADALVNPDITDVVISGDFTGTNAIILENISDKNIDVAGNNIEITVSGEVNNVTITGIQDNDDATPALSIVAGTKGELTIKDSYFYDDKSQPFGGIAGRGCPELSLTVENCEFAGDRPLYFSGALKDITVKGSTFTNSGSWAILVNNAVNGDVVIDGCTFTGCTGIFKAGVGGNGISGIAGNIKITNNTFNSNALKNNKYFDFVNTDLTHVVDNSGNKGDIVTDGVVQYQ